jgi:hypothetical protein
MQGTENDRRIVVGRRGAGLEGFQDHALIAGPIFRRHSMR